MSPFLELFDDAPCGCLVTDAGGRILWANATLVDWLGTSGADVEGKPLVSVFSVAGRILFETTLLPTLRLQGRVEEVSLDLKAIGGAKVPVLLTVDVKVDPATGSRVTRIIFMKAGARRNFERDLIDARVSAETSLSLEQQQGQLREQFVAVLGHDLRNPVASMSAAARMLSREPLSEQGAEVIRLMKGSVQRMSRLIDNVLDFARNRLGGGIELDMSSGGALEAQIRQAVDELRSVMPDRDVQISISIGRPVQCDVGRIGQMVSNLVGNALTHGDPAHPVQVSASIIDDEMFEIWVSNRGLPIPPDAMLRLFNPFERGGQDGHREGLGLGLHIASEIAKAHNGILDVTSDDIETRFIFRIPLDSE